MPKHKDNKTISIQGAKVHNLKNISLDIPRDKLIVITGLSGSGKSSLAFDTLFAEGQRRYVESLSAYARQFLGRINKPDVDQIKGIPPAIAIEQKVNSRNPRSTVGTTTEIYDYIKLLFARIGKTYSPVSGNIVKKHRVSDILAEIYESEKKSKFLIFFPIFLKKGEKIERLFEIVKQQGYSRIENGNEIVDIDSIDISKIENTERINVLIDRIIIQDDKDTKARIADSLNIAFSEGKGSCIVKSVDGKEFHYSNRFELDGMLFDEPNMHTFSFNNPVGACKTCEGFGTTIGIDPDLVVPDRSLSLYEDAVVCWKGEKMQKWKDKVIFNAEKVNFPIHKPYFDLSEEQQHMLWYGCKYFDGIYEFFKYVESKAYKIQYRVLLSRYRGKTECTECNGARLKKEALYVKISNRSIDELVKYSINDLSDFFEELKLSESDKLISERILIEISSRLKFLKDVGLGYLTLNRTAYTLSGGESQRIYLAKSLGSSLVGSLYILDEPSIGLHPRDSHLLVKVLIQLKKLKNTVIVVEHDEDIIKSADLVIDIGPEAGRFGGEVVFQGSIDNLILDGKSLTASYLSGEKSIAIPDQRKLWTDYILLEGACENNLKNIDVRFPLNVFSVVTGVSGSGKSTLVNQILYPALKKICGGTNLKPGKHKKLSGSVDKIYDIELVDQDPIGKSSRSNPVTYVKAYDEIRSLYAKQQGSVINGYKPKHFSFNVDGGRCDECQGEGIIKVEMQFMADVYLTCESCDGKRFKDDVLDVYYRGKNIFDILEMSIEQAISFFAEQEGNDEKKIVNKLQPLIDVGLGYVKMGQSSSTLSGGESQRVKLASFLGKEKSEHTLFIFDEPTTGLHFHDIKKLMDSFNALIRKGHTILIIEHNPEIVKMADWIIDLGPEGGNDGGTVIFEGTPEALIEEQSSYTGKYIADKIKKP